ncbi:MAG TPA: hypothetical protein VM243_00365 [Phycisphaerae bacterium]|nr:hypothetical protein [Phycisphaerae bacterium]
MTVGRGVALLLAFVTLAVCVVHLRTEETRLAARIQELQRDRAALRREAWALQVEIARLGTPDQIRDRVDRWRLEVQAPVESNVKLADRGQPPD